LRASTLSLRLKYLRRLLRRPRWQPQGVSPLFLVDSALTNRLSSVTS
jgi:hypothetical protein